MASSPDTATTHARLVRHARAIAGGPHDIHRRCEALREIEADSNGNVLFPPIALRDRDVFAAFYADYYFTRDWGASPEAAANVDPCLLRLFRRVHHAAINGQLLPEADRQAFFATVSEIYSERRATLPAAAR